VGRRRGAHPSAHRRPPSPRPRQLGVLRHPAADRVARRSRLRRAVRTQRGLARAARPDGRCDQRGRQAVPVGVPGPVGRLRPAAVCLGTGLSAFLGSAGSRPDDLPIPDQLCGEAPSAGALPAL
jgi:hypothetical protein